MCQTGETHMRDRDKGFTLIELIVTVAIISIFSGVVLTFVGTGAHSYRATSGNAKVQMETQDVMDQIQNIIIDVNRSVYYSYGDGMNENVGELVMNDVDTNGDATAKTFFACSGTATDNLDDEGNRLYNYNCDVILWNKQDQKLYYARRNWEGIEVAENTNATKTTNDTSETELDSRDDSKRSNTESPMDITDDDMEVADSSDEEDGNTTVLKRTSKIENPVESTLLAENITDFRVDISKAASERIVRFQFTANVNGKETTTVHSVNLRNQVQISKPYDGYNKSDSDTPWILLTNYPTEVEPGKSVTGFSKLMNGKINPDTVRWVVDSGKGAFTAGAEGASDSAVTLTANSDAVDGDIITVHVEAQTTDGKIVTSKSVAINVVNKKIPDSLVSDTKSILVGVGLNKYKLSENINDWRLHYADNTTDNDTLPIEQVHWNYAGNLAGISITENGQLSVSDDLGKSQDDAIFNLTVTAEINGKTLTGTVQVILARIDIKKPKDIYKVGTKKEFELEYKKGGLIQDSSLIDKHVSKVFKMNGTEREYDVNNNFVSEDIGDWTVDASVQLGNIDGEETKIGVMTANSSFSVEELTETGTIKLANGTVQDTIAAGQIYYCTKGDNRNHFYMEADWGDHYAFEMTWTIAHQTSGETGFEGGRNSSSSTDPQELQQLKLNVGKDEQGFVIKEDLKIYTDNNKQTLVHHYQGTLNVKVVMNLKIVNTFDNSSDNNAPNFQVTQGRRYDLKAEIYVGQYDTSSNKHTVSRLDVDNSQFYFKNNQSSIGNNGQWEVPYDYTDFQLTAGVSGEGNGIAAKVCDVHWNAFTDTKPVIVRQANITAEIIAVNNKTTLLPGDSLQLYLKVKGENGLIDTSCNWSVTNNSNARIENSYQGNIYQNGNNIPITVKAASYITESKTATVSATYTLPNKQQSNPVTININLCPLALFVNIPQNDMYYTDSVADTSEITADITNVNTGENVTSQYDLEWELNPVDREIYCISETKGAKTYFSILKSPDNMSTVSVTAKAKIKNTTTVICSTSDKINIHPMKTVNVSYSCPAGVKQKLEFAEADKKQDIQSVTASYRYTVNDELQKCKITDIPLMRFDRDELKVTMESNDDEFEKYKYIIISVRLERVIYNFYIYPTKYNVFNCEKGQIGQAITYVPTDIETICKLTNQSKHDSISGYTFMYKDSTGENCELRLSIYDKTGIGYFPNNDCNDSSAGKWFMKRTRTGKWYRLEGNSWYEFHNVKSSNPAGDKNKSQYTRYYWDLDQELTLYDNSGQELNNKQKVKNTYFWKKWN